MSYPEWILEYARRPDDPWLADRVDVRFDTESSLLRVTSVVGS